MRIPAFIHYPMPADAIPDVGHPLGLLGRMMASLRVDIADRAAARELAAMDDRMLSDIGLDPSDVPSRSHPPHDFLR